MAFYKQIIICQQWLHRYCRQLLALPCLPAEDIDDALSGLERQATTTAQQQLCQYVRSMWVESTMWPPSTWSVFQRSVRSNNDVEGWHRRLNQKASCGQLNLYLLLQLLGGDSAPGDAADTVEGVGADQASASESAGDSTTLHPLGPVGSWRAYPPADATSSCLSAAEVLN